MLCLHTKKLPARSAACCAVLLNDDSFHTKSIVHSLFVLLMSICCCASRDWCTDSSCSFDLASCPKF